MLNFFVESSHCKHIVVACGHDIGYALFLGQFVGDKQAAERMTLLEGSPFPEVIKNLGLKKTQFSAVFNKVMKPAVLATSAELTWSNVATVNRPITGELGVSSGLATPSNGYRDPKAQSDRLGPVSKGENGRIDGLTAYCMSSRRSWRDSAKGFCVITFTFVVSVYRQRAEATIRIGSSRMRSLMPSGRCQDVGGVKWIEPGMIVQTGYVFTATGAGLDRRTRDAFSCSDVNEWK